MKTRIATALWLAFLALRLCLGGEGPRFFDLLGERDVTPAYELQADFARVALDPLCTFAYDVASKDLEWLVLFALVLALRRGRLPPPPPVVQRAAWVSCGVILATLTAFAAFWAYGGPHAALTRTMPVFVGLSWVGVVVAVCARGRWRGGWRVALWLGALLLLNTILISAPLPLKRIVVADSPAATLLDMHVHTTASDGYLTPYWRLRWYRAQGLSVAAFSDHNTTDGARAARDAAAGLDPPFNALMAQEFTSRTPAIHLNVFGIEDDLVPPVPIPELIRMVKARGGKIIVNHYVEDVGEPRPFTPAQLADAGIDGAEIANGWTDMEAFGTRAEMRAFCLARGLVCSSGSDEHQNREIGVFTRIDRDLRGTSVAAVFAALAENRHQIVEIRAPGPLHVPFAWRLLDDPARVVNHLLTMGRVETLVWAGWSLGALALLRRRKPAG